MLCYAWGHYQERYFVEVESLQSKDLMALFCSVLLRALGSLVKKGLYKEYVGHEDELGVIRGKLDFSDSLRRQSLLKARVVCQYDEFSEDVIHNQLIKATLKVLLQVENLDDNMKVGLRRLYPYFSNVTDISLSSKAFQVPRLHQNNQQYGFILQICEFLFQQVLIQNGNGRAKFKDFEISEEQMAVLFEAFVRNFYIKECSDFKVYREDIKWEASGDELQFLPLMKTDISIKAEHRKIIIDTKFYKEVLNSNFNAQKLKSQNLYQLYAYLGNDPDRYQYEMEGILLYPEVQRDLTLHYQLQDKRLKIMTVNLNQDWQGIHERLFEVVGGIDE